MTLPAIEEALDECDRLAIYLREAESAHLTTRINALKMAAVCAENMQAMIRHAQSEIPVSDGVRLVVETPRTEAEARANPARQAYEQIVKMFELGQGDV